MKPTCVIKIKADGLASVCAWCPDKAIGDQWCRSQGYSTTHGVCPTCAQNQISELLARK